MEELDLNLYILAELKYKKKYGNLDENEIFPIDWYKNKNYKLKTEIIAEALKKNIRIEETELYFSRYQEKVVD